MKVFITGVAAFGPSGRGLDAATGGERRIDDAVVKEALTMRGLRPLSRTARLAMVVAADLLPPGSGSGDEDAVVLGSAWSSVAPLADFVRVAAREGPDRVFPMAFPNTVVSVHAGYLATLLDITGPSVSVCGEHAGLEAVVEGLSLLTSGRASRVLAVAADAAEGTVTAARPEQSEAAAGLLLSDDRGADACLAAVTACWVAPDLERLPAEVRDPAYDVDELAGTRAVGAAAGALAVARAADLVSRSGEPLFVSGRSGVRGVAALRLEPA